MPTHQLLHTSITIEASYANSRTFDVYYRIDMLDAFRFTIGFYFFMENLVSSVRLLTEIGALTKSEKRNYECIKGFCAVLQTDTVARTLLSGTRTYGLLQTAPTDTLSPY